jgi:penicillin-binding protein 1A
MKFPATREKVAAVDSNIANTVTYALEGVVQYGTGTAAGISGLPVAGKTGTSQDYKNAWFCGFTPPPVESSDYRQVAVCVWVGYKKHERPMYDVGGVSGPIYGGTIPAAIWNDFVSEIMGSIDTAGVDFLAPDLSQFTGGPGQPQPSPKPSKSPPASPGASLSPGPKPTPSSSP